MSAVWVALATVAWFAVATTAGVSDSVAVYAVLAGIIAAATLLWRDASMSKTRPRAVVADWLRRVWADSGARDDALTVDPECTCGEECPVHSESADRVLVPDHPLPEPTRRALCDWLVFHTIDPDRVLVPGWLERRVAARQVAYRAFDLDASPGTPFDAMFVTEVVQLEEPPRPFPPELLA